MIDQASAARIETRLQARLDSLGGGRVGPCGPVFLLNAPDTSGLASSDGAVCTVEAGRSQVSALMCENAHDGLFALSLTPLRSLEAIRVFVIANCYPRG